jgi:hypothetical protein
MVEVPSARGDRLSAFGYDDVSVRLGNPALDNYDYSQPETIHIKLTTLFK